MKWVSNEGLPWWLTQSRIYLQCKRHRFNPWVGKTPGEGNGYPLQYSCLENPMDRETGWLQSTEMQRAQHDWVTNTFTFFFFFPVTIRLCTTPGLPRWLNGKESASQCRRHRRHEFHLWVGKIPWKGNGNPLQYSCLENPMDRGTWQATVHGVSKTQMLLNTEVHTHTIWDSIPCKGT